MALGRWALEGGASDTGRAEEAGTVFTACGDEADEETGCSSVSSEER
jgi:hypothetical protein